MSMYNNIESHLKVKPATIPAILAVLVTLYHLGQVKFGVTTLFYDAREVWKPFAEQVLAGGTPYIAVEDNKPPLFQYLNIVIASTGEYTIAWYGFLAAANASIVVLVGNLTSDWKNHLVAGLLVVSSLPVVYGDLINVRSVALVPLLLAIGSSRPLHRGVLVAASGMVCQFAAFAAPVLGWRYLQNQEHDQLGLYITAGLGTVMIVFLPLLFWGNGAVIEGVDSTFLAIGEYTTRPSSYTLWTNPVDYLGVVASRASQLAIVFVPMALYFGSGHDIGEVEILAILLALPLAVKSLEYYWLLPLPFQAVLAARYITGRSD